jgi:hypothetical protein
MKKLIILFCFLSLNSVADTGSLNFTVGPLSAKKESGALNFLAPPGHHFNAQAPSHVQAMINGAWQGAEKMEARGSKFFAEWSTAFDPCQGVKAELYVCDDKNTYCLPRTQTFKCVNEKLVSSDEKDRAEIAVPQAPVTQVKTSAEEAKFIMNDSVRALKLAVSAL